jgi:hypothetical protein
MYGCCENVQKIQLFSQEYIADFWGLSIPTFSVCEL